MPHKNKDQEHAKLDIKDTVSFIAQSSANYIKVKAELASIEAKEATSVLGKKAAAGSKAAFFGAFAYILLIATLVGVGSKLLEGRLPQIEQHIGTWPIVTAALFLIHIIIAVIFFDKIKKVGNDPIFQLTKTELEKDKQWLQEMKNNSES